MVSIKVKLGNVILVLISVIRAGDLIEERQGIIKMEDIEIEHTTEGVINRCKKCGEEITSMLHKCPFWQGEE